MDLPRVAALSYTRIRAAARDGRAGLAAGVIGFLTSSSDLPERQNGTSVLSRPWIESGIRIGRARRWSFK